MSYRTMTIVLSDDEVNALRRSAEVDLRRPRDQARYLVRQALGLAEKPPATEKHNGAAQAVTGNCGAAVLTVQG
jgi:hypothetical protein